MHIKTTYEGNLRTHATHIKSQNSLQTDAPVDNQGKGESFSPTDLVATALTSCMMTIMGIEAEKMKISLSGLSATTEKIMTASPRKISRLRINFSWPNPSCSLEQQKFLKEKALTCPVALSLSESLKQDVTFDF